MSADTIPSRLQRWARTRPQEPAYHVKQGGQWRAVTWADYAAETRRAGRALCAYGMKPGECVCVLGGNRPEWAVFAVAAMSIGAAPAGIYTTCSAVEVQYIIGHAGARVVLVEDHAQWEKIRSKRAELPALEAVVLMKGAAKVDDPLVLTWAEFLARGDGVDEARFAERVAALAGDQLATLIYTSGTTGPPKGVMLTHRNLTWTADALCRIIESGPEDCTLSYLPLSHIAEQMATIHAAISRGSQIYYAESLEKVPENLKEVRPTIFFGVPRIWEKFYAAVSGRLAEVTGPKKYLLAWARDVAKRATALLDAGSSLPVFLEAQYRLAQRVVLGPLKARMGLDRTRIFISGAAPISKEILELFATLDIIVHEIYGQSEGTGPTSTNRPGRTRFGTVGPVIDGVEVKIAADGEILVRGANVFAGYYKEPEATSATLIDGWLQSGDLGEFDADGYLSITGRKKDILITAGGKNIAPKNIEAALKNHPLVGEAVVIGDRRKFLSCLVSLDPDAAAKFLAGRNLPADAPHTRPEVRAAIQAAVDEVNRDLARVESVKKFTILARPFSIETGELTPSLKVKRKAVGDKYAAEIEAMYKE